MRIRIPVAGASLALALVLSLFALTTVRAQTPTPTADDTSASLGSTNPPLAVTIVLTGSEQAATSNPAFTIASYPTKGTLAPITAVTCTQTVPQSGGTTSVSCSAEVKYTPVADSIGTDSFTFTFANGGVTSSAATVTITLPPTVGATPTPTATPSATATATATPTATATATPAASAGAFDRPLTLTGVNAAIWLGGTIEQMEAAAQAAGATSVTAYVNGQAEVLIIGAPGFVNSAFALAFPGDDVPANTVVLVTIL